MLDEDDELSCKSPESLLLTVEALRAQLEEQTKLCKEQVNPNFINIIIVRNKF